MSYITKGYLATQLKNLSNRILEVFAKKTDVDSALSGKSDTGHTHTKSDVGLGNVDNVKQMPISSWNWAPGSGQPSWIWGGNEMDKYYVYRPSELEVGSAKKDGNGNVITDTYLKGSSFSSITRFIHKLLAGKLLYITSESSGDTIHCGGRGFKRTNSEKVIIGKCATTANESQTSSFYIIAKSKDAFAFTDYTEYASYLTKEVKTPAGNTVYVATMGSAWGSPNSTVVTVCGGTSYTISEFSMYSRGDGSNLDNTWIYSVADAELFGDIGSFIIYSSQSLPLSGGTLTGDVSLPIAKSSVEPSLPVSSGTMSISDITSLCNYKTYLGSYQHSGTWYNLISTRHRNGCSDGTGYGMYLRSRLTSSGNLTWGKQTGSSSWQDERTILDSANYSSYALPLSGGTVSGSLKVNGGLNIGDKVIFWSDNEGGNIRWYSPEGVQWEFDCFDENFRLFNYNSFKDFRITRDEGDVYLPNNLYLNASAPILKLNNFYIHRNGNPNCETHIYGYTASDPHIMLRQYSNAFQFLPHANYAINNGSHIGHSEYRFGDGYFTNLYNSSGAITTSDRNKKHDIEEISDEFSKKIVDGLIPSSFKFNDGSSGRTHFGIIAQDLEKLLEALGISTSDFAPLVKEYPDKEVEIENPDYDENDENSQKYIKKLEKDYDAEPIYNVRYEEFIMILVKYCQCLKKKDLDLEKRLSELEEKVNSLIAG